MVRLRRGAAAIAIVVGLAVTVRSARADDALAPARAAIEQADYAAAKTAVDAVLATGSLGPDELAEAYRLRGTVAGAMGDATGATESFTRLLSLAPKTTLPFGTSPKISKAFDKAAAYAKTHEPLKVKVDTQASPPSLTLVVTSDPLKLVAKTRVWVIVDGKPGGTLDGTGAIALPPGKRLDLRVAALDDRGNRLVELGTADVPIVLVGREAEAKPDRPAVPVVTPVTPVVETPAVHEPAHERALYARWWLWGGVTVVVAGVAGYFSYATYQAKQDLVALEATSQFHTFDEAKQVEDRGHRDALIANITFGVAGATAIATTILFFTRPRHTDERMTRVLPVAHQGGGGVALEVPF